jgi:hypothetical protein
MQKAEDDVNDDDSGEIIWSDLSHEVPTGRAEALFQLGGEITELEGHFDGHRGGVRLRSVSAPGSPQSIALTTLHLAVASCLIAGVAWAIGVPAMTALIAGLGAVIGMYVLVHLTAGRRARG